ncbi:MAG: MoaD/ThiS family protein [Bacteroidetes bacterium]|nr:MoaD/ThiS family protein [Bacteroidota bacterium]
MKVKVLYFGMTAEITGKDSELVGDVNDSDSLDDHLKVVYPELKKAGYRIAVNLEMINENTVLRDGDEFALLPPFAGG